MLFLLPLARPRHQRLAGAPPNLFVCAALATWGPRSWPSRQPDRRRVGRTMTAIIIVIVASAAAAAAANDDDAAAMLMATMMIMIT